MEVTIFFLFFSKWAKICHNRIFLKWAWQTNSRPSFLDSALNMDIGNAKNLKFVLQFNWIIDAVYCDVSCTPKLLTQATITLLNKYETKGHDNLSLNWALNQTQSHPLFIGYQGTYLIYKCQNGKRSCQLQMDWTLL